MSRWEYAHVAYTSGDEYGQPRLVHFDGMGRAFNKDASSVMSYLNELGNEGWELISVTDFSGGTGGQPSGISYYLKRPR
jgi:hypothetical protein